MNGYGGGMPEQKLIVAILDQAGLIKMRLISAINDIENIAAVDLERQDFECIGADVVILDIHMLKGQGLALIRQLKSLERPPLVIVFTLYVNAQSQCMCRTAGADYFFDKAQGFEQLTAVLNNTHTVKRRNY
jgi:two-component system, NarL family, response regulator DevR